MAEMPENYEVVEKLVAGEQAFVAWGWSDLKVTQDGVVKYKRVRIKSIGLAEMMERFSRQGPVPPRRTTLVKRDSAEGRSAGLTHDKLMIEEDFTDAKFKEDQRAFNMRVMYLIVLGGLAVDICDRNGNLVVKSNATRSATEIIDEDAAILALKDQEFSNDHIERLYADIRALTSSEQKRVDMD